GSTAPSVDWRDIDVHAAAARIAGHVVRTPLLRLPIDTPSGHAVYVKPESLQRTGSFKLRGATNFIANLSAEQRARGVVAHSSGNHAQGVAAAAKAFGVQATIVIPEGAIEMKVANTKALGATVVRCENTQEGREGTARAIAERTGAVMTPPYDHRDIVAGQGTVGLEIVEDLPDVANVIVPIGGGGLSAGVAIAVTGARPGCRVIGVEPELAADAHQSLLEGRRVSWPAESVNTTAADGVRTQSIGVINFAVLSELLAGVVTVGEEAIARATRWYALTAHLVTEPTGALSLAALWQLLAEGSSDGISLLPGPTVLIISGGNVEPTTLCTILGAA
ncbi:MAG TPA: threonine/serine dehydratase, partial [Trueperaceae bacterium]|nr:threonine/serine dehydratase [Trueperaceae bacterium]